MTTAEVTDRVGAASPHSKARIAGFFYLLTFLTGGTALFIRGNWGLAAGLVAGAEGAGRRLGKLINLQPFLSQDGSCRKEKEMYLIVKVTKEVLDFLGESVQTLLPTLLILLVGSIGVALAQNNPPTAGATSQSNPFSANTKMVYQGVKAILLGSAEKMPEENYSFKPTDSVRSFGQILGHAADSQYSFCSAVLGEKNPALKIEQTKTSKADLIAALKESCAYCDKAYDSMTDTSGAEMVKHMGRDMPKLGVLNVNIVHSVEHYGNLITYLRMKNLVPPTSDPDFMRQMMK